MSEAKFIPSANLARHKVILLSINTNLEAYWNISAHRLPTIILDFSLQNIVTFCCLVSLEKGKNILNMSLYSELLESYALQITAVRDSSYLLMKRRIRPNMVSTKDFRSFLCKSMVWEFKFSRQKTGVCRRHQRLWDNATDYKQVWTT